MSVPYRINDGSFDTERQIDADVFITPFADVGDHLTFEVIRKYRIDQSKYKRGITMAKIKTRKGVAYLVDQSEPSYIGSGLVEYTKTFSCLPASRQEASSYVYSYQFLSTNTSYDWDNPPPEPTVSEIPRTIPVVIQYSYAIGGKNLLAAMPFTLNRAPKVEVINGTILTTGGWGSLVVGKWYLAEDETFRIYKGRIYEKRGIWFQWPDLRKA